MTTVLESKALLSELVVWMELLADEQSPLFKGFRHKFEQSPVYIEPNGFSQRVTAIERRDYVLLEGKYYYEVLTAWGNTYRLESLSEDDLAVIHEIIVP